MLYGLYISAGGLQANELRMAVGANNLANVNTAGFKVDNVVVQPRARSAGGGRTAPAELSRLAGGVWATRTVTDFLPGSLDATNNPFDIALDTGSVADGFLGVRGNDGKPAWTRDGRMTVDGGGRLITQSGGLTVLDDTGQPITIDPAGGPIAIDSVGNISQGQTQVGRLRLASFDRPELLAKQGGNLFVAGASATPGEFRGRVVQGHVEGSAAEPTTLLARLIQVQRAYEANANMIRFQDQTLGRAVNDIAKI